MLALGFGASPRLFRTGWFVESLLTELLVALVVRTRRRFWQSRPGALLRDSTALLIVAAIGIPYIPWARVFGFEPLPAGIVIAIVTIAILYVIATEATKSWFFRPATPVAPVA